MTDLVAAVGVPPGSPYQNSLFLREPLSFLSWASPEGRAPTHVIESNLYLKSPDRWESHGPNTFTLTPRPVVP